VVGISHHVIGAELPLLLKRTSAAEPGLVLEMRVSTSREMIEEFDGGAIDAAIVLRHDNRRKGGEIVLEEQFCWMAAPDFVHHAGEPLRLAAQAAPCSVRSMAIDALNAAGVAWTEVFVGGGIATTGAAVSAGLATAALGRRVAPPGTIDVGPRFDLPPLPTRDVVLHSNAGDRQAKNLLKTLMAAIRATAN
jgi:DNA-binding transcriptional LysR family regulator